MLKATKRQCVEKDALGNEKEIILQTTAPRKKQRKTPKPCKNENDDDININDSQVVLYSSYDDNNVNDETFINELGEIIDLTRYFNRNENEQEQQEQPPPTKLPVKKKVKREDSTTFNMQQQNFQFKTLDTIIQQQHYQHQQNNIKQCNNSSSINEFCAENETEFCVNESMLEKEEEFRVSTCLKNAVCTIKCADMKINTQLFTNKFGGQLTGKLSGNRIVVKISNKRYSFITYSTGTIVLTNFFYFVNNSLLYSFFVNLIVYIYLNGIGEIVRSNDDSDDDSDDSDDDDSNKNTIPTQKHQEQLKISFLLENFIFAFQIAPQFFNNRFVQLYEELHAKAERTPHFQEPYLEKMQIFRDNLAKRMRDNNYDLQARFCRRENFTAGQIQFSIRRSDWQSLKQYKSAAAQRRKKNNFDTQNVAILIFENGKMIVTGMQTHEDLEATFTLLFAIVDFFFV